MKNPLIRPETSNNRHIFCGSSLWYGYCYLAAQMNWLQIVRSEYLEIPGLHLNRAQVRRFWNLDDVTCDELLRALTSVKFLKRTSAGAYVRTDGGAS